MLTIARPTASASPSLEIVNWNHKKKVLKGFDWRTKTERLGSLDSLTNSYCPCMKTARWLFDNFQMTAWKQTAWRLPEDCLMTILHLHDECLTNPWWLSNYCKDRRLKDNCHTVSTAWRLSTDWLATGWSLSSNCLTTASKLPNDYIPDDYLITAWWLPDDCLITVWWLHSNCLLTAWQLPDDCLTTAWQMSD